MHACANGLCTWVPSKGFKWSHIESAERYSFFFFIFIIDLTWHTQTNSPEFPLPYHQFKAMKVQRIMERHVDRNQIGPDRMRSVPANYIQPLQRSLLKKTNNYLPFSPFSCNRWVLFTLLAWLWNVTSPVIIWP